MVHLDCSGITFGSQLDEKHLFEWAAEITGFLRWDRDTLVVRSRLSETALRDLLALFNRYGVSMKQLAQFRTTKNEHWFAAPHMYWHRKVFSGQETTHHPGGTASSAAELKRQTPGMDSSARLMSQASNLTLKRMAAPGATELER